MAILDKKSKYIYKNKTYFTKPQDDPSDTLEIEVGDSKDLNNFQPQVKIKRWDNEVNFSARLIDDEQTKPTISKENNKVVWKNKKKEYHFYEEDVDFTKHHEKDFFSFKTSFGGISKGRILNDTALIYSTKATPNDEKLLEKTILKLSEEFNVNYIEIPSQTDRVVSIFQHFVDKGLLTNPELNEYSKDHPSKWNINKQYKNSIINDFYNDEIDSKKEKSFEFEVVLKEKPSTNKLQFTLQRKGLEFFYQPELTDEEKRQGNYRPDNVVGSYAVYYKDCPQNIKGGKEYKTGKAFHIFRPLINDSSGREVWGDLHIDEEKDLLTVTIPQEFLDTAVYPIQHAAGLTFGYTSVGASFSSDNGGNITRGYQFASGGTGKGVSISAYFGEKTSGKGCLGTLYTRSGTTETFVTDSATTTNTAAITNAWVTMPFSTAPTLADQNYDICIIVEGVGKGDHNNMAYDTAGTVSVYDNTMVYPTPDSTFTNIASGYGYTAYKYSIYTTVLNATNIDSTSDFASLLGSGRNLLRDSGGHLYSVLRDGTDIEVWTPGVTSTYYFDASDSGPTDPNAVWTNDANAFDGSTSTSTFCSTAGSASSNYLQGAGTNAPASGDSIAYVKARTSGNSFTDYVLLSEPSGGWTWTKIQSLACRIWVNPADEGNSPVHTAIYTSDDIGGTPLGTVDGATTPNSIKIVEIEVTTQSTDGTDTWIELDSANSPLCAASSYYAAAIDSSDTIHVVYCENSGTVDYQTFVSGAWGTSEEVNSTVSSTSYDSLAIAIDSNDKPHITYSKLYSGVPFPTAGEYYKNRISGSWTSEITVSSGGSYDTTFGSDITINLQDRPIIANNHDTGSDNGINVYLGNTNNATTFSSNFLTTGPTSGYNPSLAVDSSGDVWAAYQDDSAIRIAKQSSDWTSSWTEYSTGNDGQNPSLYIDADDNKYVFYENDDTDTKICYDVYSGSWLGETILQQNTGIDYSFAKTRYGSIIENDSAGSIVTSGAVIDSYSESNQSSIQAVASGIRTAVGQSFTGDGSLLDSVKFNLGYKNGSPTGNCYAKIYAHSGTFGTSSVPTGTVLATSDAVDVSTLSAGTIDLITFNFSGDERITLTDTTKYVVVFEYTGGDGSNYPYIGSDATSPTHAGNQSKYVSSWIAYSSTDTIFYVNAFQTKSNPVEIDYIFTDGTDVYYSSLTLVTATTVDTSIQAKARIKLPTTKTVTAKTRVKQTGQTKTVTAKARIVSTGVTKSVEAKARVKQISTVSIQSKARIKYGAVTKTIQSKAFVYKDRIDSTTLVSPVTTTSGTSPVIFVWVIPTNTQNEPVHSQIQIDDTDSSFASLEIDQTSFIDNTGMEYWNGSSWVEYPSTGVTSTYFGNQARLTTALTTGTKYWRVRGISG